MKRALAIGTLPLLLTTLFACGERIIIVREPAQNAGAKGGTQQIATDPNFLNSPEAPWGIQERPDPVEYSRVVEKVAAMTEDNDLRRRARARGLDIVNVAWEDTGRNEGSSVGPNISDLSLQVRERSSSAHRRYDSNWQGDYRSTVMPVIRHPNFSDKTADVAADKFFVRVGNERSNSLRSVSLAEMLRNIRSYVSVPSSIVGDGNMLASRDSHFLVSAQAVFLPIPKTGKAEFNPVLFNYQSTPGHPAVMSILVTRQGTSVSVIENRSEDSTGAGWGQELYFNAGGERAALTAERKSDVVERIAAQGGPKTEDDRSAIARGADVLFLIQVPLVHAQPRRYPTQYYGPNKAGGMSAAESSTAPVPSVAPKSAASSPRRSMDRDEASDVEQAVLGHGPNVGPFNEGRGLRLVRDSRFPVRVTVQFYKATSNGVVSDIDLDGISRSIGSVYEHADYVGSLVMPDGDPRRPTAWQKPMPREWFPW